MKCLFKVIATGYGNRNNHSSRPPTNANHSLTCTIPRTVFIEGTKLGLVVTVTLFTTQFLARLQ